MLATLECLPQLECQLHVLALELALYTASLVLLSRALARALAAHPAKGRIVARVMHDMRTMVGWGLDEAAAWTHFCETLVVGAQHILGGLCVLPALLSLGPERLRVPLVCVGALSEVAFDVHDTVRRSYQHVVRGALPGGRATMCFVLAHHQLSIAFALPMNLLYAGNAHYQHMAFNLMGAGGAAVFLSSAAQALDVSTRAGLLRMRALNATLLGVVLWTRVFAYVPLSVLLLHTLYRDGSWKLLALGTLGLSAMGGINAVLLQAMHRRMRKFWRMPLPPIRPVGASWGRYAGGSVTTPSQSSSESEAARAAFARAAEDEASSADDLTAPPQPPQPAVQRTVSSELRGTDDHWAQALAALAPSPSRLRDDGDAASTCDAAAAAAAMASSAGLRVRLRKTPLHQ